MSNKIGEQSWTSNQGNGGGEGVGKTDFMRLAHGSNVVRILTLPHAYYVHKVENPNGSGKSWGTRIPCTNSPDCPVCKLPDNRPKKKYYLGCIERKTGMYKVLDIGYSIFKGLQVFAQDDEWGPDFSQYDVDIVVNQKGTPMDYYRCSPKPKRPLSEADLTTKAEHATDDLSKRCQPWTVERAQAALDKMNEDNEAHFESDLVMKGKDISDDQAASDDFFTNYDTVKSKK